MAAFGAKYPCFAPFSGEEPAGALPVYDKMVVIGGLVSANVTINLASGELYADDALAEMASEFASATIAMETDDLIDEVESVIFGSTAAEGELVDNIADAAPFGGLGYYRKLMRDGKIFYRTYFYPKVKAALGNDNAQTKGNNITFQTSQTTFTVFAPNTGDWRYREVFDNEAAATAWLNAKFLPAAGA